MGKTAEMTERDGYHKSQAQTRLAETLQILRPLSAERQREERRRVERPNFVSEVEAILSRA